MLRPSRINPKKSTYNKIVGNFDFNKTPLAPPGYLIVAYEYPQDRGTWADHGVKGYFIGPAKTPLSKLQYIHSSYQRRENNRYNKTLPTICTDAVDINRRQISKCDKRPH